MQPHLKISNKDISTYVLLPGDPARVDIIGSYLKKFKVIANNREFKVGVGNYKSKLVTVCSTGIGGPSTAIAAEELIAAGAQYLIRVGTCGGAWRKNIKAGSAVIVTGSVRDDGTTNEYIPLGYPAIADYRIVAALNGAAEKNTLPFYLGINRSHDAFYGTNDSITKWGGYLTAARWQMNDTPILTSDMETAALLVVASLKNIAGGAILAVNADPEPLRERVVGNMLLVTAEKSTDLTARTLAQTIQIALDAIAALP